MKTKCLHLLAVFTLLCGATAQSQIILTPLDLPEFGLTLESAQDTLLPVDIELGTASDQSQSWDFTGLDTSLLTINTVVDPASTPAAALFPTATFAFESNDSLYSYAELREDALLALGGSAPIFDNDPISIVYDPPQQLLTVPATYGSSFSAPFRLEVLFDGSALGADSILVISNGMTSGEVDAYGDITVPAGTFPALRQYAVTTSVDSIFVKAFGTFFLVSAESDTTISYQWWGQDGLGTICDIEVATDGTPISATYLTSFEPAPQAPMASFTIEEQQPGQFQFTDASTNNPTSWSWDFGDGTTSDEQNPQHTYSEAGIYTVCLTASNAEGADEACQEVTVVFAPQAAFSIEMLSDSSFQFNDLSTNTPTSWEWDFGDGTTSDEQNPMHTYAASGDYTVCLTAANTAGSDTSCNAVEVVIVSAEEQAVSLERLVVFPSPAQDRASLHFEGFNLSQEAEVSVNNILGQPMLIRRFSQLPQDYSFIVADWQAGLYYVVVRIGGKRVVQPFSVQ